MLRCRKASLSSFIIRAIQITKGRRTWQLSQPWGDFNLLCACGSRLLCRPQSRNHPTWLLRTPQVVKKNRLRHHWHQLLAIVVAHLQSHRALQPLSNHIMKGSQLEPYCPSQDSQENIGWPVSRLTCSRLSTSDRTTPRIPGALSLSANWLRGLGSLTPRSTSGTGTVNEKTQRNAHLRNKRHRTYDLNWAQYY